MATPLSRNIRVCSDADAVAQTAARLFSSAAAVAIAARMRFSVALSGGSTPTLLYRTLGSSFRHRADWQHVHLFWTDERCVPKEDPESNFGSVSDEMLSHIEIPENNVHRIKGELAPEDAAMAYEADLRNHFGSEGIPRFDLIFLGVGEDGHTASLFPGSETLSEVRRLAVPAYSGDTGNWRVSLTLPVLNNASLAVFLVTGQNKAEIMTRMLSNDDRSSYPAGSVSPHHGRLIWLLDKDAASAIKARK